MYQTRRKLALLRDTANIVPLKPVDNFCNPKVVHPKKSIASRKINLFKRDSNTDKAACINKENEADKAQLVQTNTQKSDKRPSSRDWKTNKAKNSTWINQIEEENFAANFKSLNKVSKHLIYSKCEMPVKKKRNVDVYDISADDDLKKEKKVQFGNKKGLTREDRRRNICKSLKKAVHNEVTYCVKNKAKMERKLPNLLVLKESANLKIQQRVASKKLNTQLARTLNKLATTSGKPNLNIPHQLANPLVSLKPIYLKIQKEGNLNGISVSKFSSCCPPSINANTFESPKSINNGAKVRHSDKENILMKNNLLNKSCLIEGNEMNKGNGKKVVREATPVRDSTGDRLSVPEVVPQTSTPRSSDKPTFDFEHEFASHMSEIPISPLEVPQRNNWEAQHFKLNLDTSHPGIPDIPQPDTVQQKGSSQEKRKTKFNADEYFESLLALPDEGIEFEDQISLQLFGSPEKVEHQGTELLSDIDGSPIKKSSKKKNGQHCKEADFIQKKTSAEKKLEEEEEAFYKSFNDHLSDLDNYELCIE